MTALSGDTHVTNRNLLIGPSVSTGDWTPEMVWNTGFVDAYSQNLAYLSVEQYGCSFTFYNILLNTSTAIQLIIVSHNSASELLAIRKVFSLRI